MMKKAIIIITAVVLLAVLVVGVIHTTTLYLPAPLRKWEQNNLAKAIGDDSFDNSEWTELDDDPRGRKYFGKYNGYYVVSTSKITAEIRTETAGVYTFNFNSYTIGVWKDGIRMKLSYAYEQGEISNEDIAKIYEYHTQIESAIDKYMEENGYR